MLGGNQSGLEMALRSMGLGTVLDAAKHLAESGAVQKIINFADALEGFNARSIDRRLERIERQLGLSEIIDAEPIRIGGSQAQSGSGSADSDAA